MACGETEKPLQNHSLTSGRGISGADGGGLSQKLGNFGWKSNGPKENYHLAHELQFPSFERKGERGAPVIFKATYWYRLKTHKVECED